MCKEIKIKNRIASIAVQLEDGRSSTEIIRDCSAEWNISGRTVERYLAIAKDIVIEKMDNMNALIEAVRGTVIAEEAEKNLRSNLELEAKLISILEGELEVQKVITKTDDTTEIKLKPSHTTMLKAIDLLWRRRGLYHASRPKSDSKPEYKLPEIKVSSEEAKALVEKVFKLP